MKNFYIAIGNEIDGKYYAHAWRVRDSDNLCSIFKQFPHAIHMNIMPTKKAAVATAQAWNDSARNSGSYMFADNMPF